MQYRAVVCLAGILLMASPVAAAPSTSGRTADQERTYCFRFSSDTGSRIARTECKTRSEWARLGVDVDELLRQ